MDTGNSSGRESETYRAHLAAMEDAHDKARARCEEFASKAPAEVDASEGETEVKRPLPEHKQHYSQFVPSRPRKIANAVPRARVPVQLDDGLIVMTGSRAPLTEKEIEELEMLQEKEIAQDKNFRRLQQSAMKHEAFKNNDGSHAFTFSNDRGATDSELDEDEEYPDYQRHVMKPLARRRI
ncbi:hypothetical protein NUW58_g2486 [Xylaria curta]|uniref:Uncharacterized protein n=1 Tax=Xylaria curta TaxID=42375 RepID=A0ACC1PFB7_9PEZI|nr:hypothetical protein NUW58_g2486 [Xylaria curta]